MQVKIFKPIKSPMQSALSQEKWILEAKEKDKAKSKYITGWTSSDDMNTEIRIFFSTKERAIEYAKKNFFVYQVIEEVQFRIKPRSYAQNFTKKTKQ